MKRTNQEILLEAYAQEYDKHRDEMQNRIGIQNGMAERAMSITVLLGSVLAGLFTFFMKDIDAPSAVHRTDLFVSACIPLLVVHGVLTQFTLAAWIYQLSMVSRIVRYWNWMVEQKIEPIMGHHGEVYLWDRHPLPPWDTPVDVKVVRYFQPLFVYGLCSLGLLALPLCFWWSPQDPVFRLVRALGFAGAVALAVSLSFFALVHLKVVRGTEAFRHSLDQAQAGTQTADSSKEVGPTR